LDRRVLFVIVIVVALVVVVTWGKLNLTGGLVGLGEVTERVYITPFSDVSDIKQGVNVLHNLGNSFTADVPVSLMSELKDKAYVSEVSKYIIPIARNPADKSTKRKVGSRDCFPVSKTPWGVSKVNGGSGGNGITVAVLDTGVTKHPDLKISVCKDATRGRFIQNGCNDNNGHGTFVAGIIAANGGDDGRGITGVAPGANIMAIKVCDADGSCWSDDIAAGIRYAADNGANIISMSFGSSRNDPVLNDAIDYASSKGVLLVAAAGNDGPDDGSIDYPAANANVIGVGAIDSSDKIPFWSSRGDNYNTVYWVVNEKDIEFVAPGVAIDSTWKNGCYLTLDGTSAASPHIAGLAAKLWQGSASATRTYLQNRARYNYADIGRSGDDPDAGFGLPTAP